MRGENAGVRPTMSDPRVYCARQPRVHRRAARSNHAGFPVQSFPPSMSAPESKSVPMTAAEAALLATEERYRFVTEALPIYIWYGPQGGFEYCNQRLLEFTGLTFDQIRAGESLKLIHPDDIGRLLAAAQRSFATGEEYSQEYRIRRHDGVYRWHLAHSRRFVDHRGDVKWLGVSVDITERREAENALRAANERLSLALETARMGVWEWDVKSGQVRWSDEVAALHGLPPGSFDGTFEAWVQTIHAEDRDRTVAAARRVLDGEGAYEAEYRTVRPDGSSYWTFARGILSRHPDGTPARLVGVCLDITSRKLAEEALRRSETLATAGRMAATIAHEINNPLEAVTNIVYVAHADPAVPEDIRSLLADADNELRHVAHIVRRTLGFYREDAPAGAVSLAELAHDVADLYRRKIDARNLRFACDIPADLTATGVVGELRQVLANLLANAIAAVPSGGEISMCGRATETGSELIVTDNGPGVPPHLVSRLFEPFFTTKSNVGTGLGLWVSHKIAQKHGGNLRYERGASGKTRFILDLPR